jgi:hypothetical protein
MKKSPPKVSIIILNYNGKGVLGACLSSVFAVDYPNLEVILVDNNSKDGSFEEAKTNFSKAVFIKNKENLGFAAGNNAGIQFALEKMADYVLLLNYDTEVERDFVTRLIDVAESDDGIGVLSPLIFEGRTKRVWFSGGKINWFRMKILHEKNPGKRNLKSYPTEFISGCSMMVKNKVFEKIGLLDEDFFLYCEDADFSYRAKKAGFKRMIVPQSIVYHYEKSEEIKASKVYWLVISGLIFFKKNAPPWIKPWIFLYVLLRKLKNFLDIKINNKIELALSVRKAYGDFEREKL